jgi:hypothetical protein
MRLMESVGECLKAERESQNLSLQEVSESTKIRELLLRALEEDRGAKTPWQKRATKKDWERQTKWGTELSLSLHHPT